MKPLGYIVVFDDEQGLCVPYGNDPDCEGALCCVDGPVAVFPDRKSAARAIRISQKLAELMELRGEPANTDFLGDSRKAVKIQPLERAVIPELPKKKS